VSEVWTLDALKEHFDARFDAVQQAVRTADAASEKRLDNVNEFRATLADQQKTFITRAEAAWLVMFLLSVIVASIAVANYFGGAAG